MLIVTDKSTPHYAQKESGGKGANLYWLTRAGLQVPRWYVIGKSFFEDFLTHQNLQHKLDLILQENDKDPKQASALIEELFCQTPLPEKTREILVKSYREFNCNLIAVRSSAADEDSSSHSFAGQLSSYLYIKTEAQYLESIVKCWASAYTERSLIYRQQNNLDKSQIKVAVVIQQMIDPEVSGVAFTCDPLNGSPTTMTINAVYGVGEGLVSGLLDADTYVVEKETKKILEQEIVTKEKKLGLDPEKEGPRESAVEKDLQERSSLDEGQLKKLSELLLKIENEYHYPQDIEWAYKDGEFTILQSRPVTTQVQTGLGTLFIWDNSNIVESYGGLTMPLTFGFARYVYHQVYVQFCEILMVPWKHIREMDFFLQNMLGLFYGRVYYNLLNWYKLTSILPGYKFNKNFMETMMGTNKALEDEIAERIKPPAFQDNFTSKMRKMVTGLKFFYFHLNIQYIVDKFLQDFKPIYNKFRKIDYSRMESSTIYEEFMKLEKEMLWKWHAPIINDFLCMIHYGIFKKLTEKWLSHLGDAFHNDLMAGNGNLESAEPTKRLIVLAGKIEKDPALKELILNHQNQDLLEALRQSNFKEFEADVLDYIDRFGFRCMSEMKLEQKDLHQDPSLLFVFLKNILKSGQTDLEKYEQREKEIKQKAEDLLASNLFGLKKLIYLWSLKHARKAVMNRENTRFCRTRIYGVVRAMFYGIGKDFTLKKILNAPEDVFYLSFEELKGAFEGRNTIQNLHKVVALRKEEYELYADQEPAPRFHTRGANYVNNQHFPEEEQTIDESQLLPHQLKGIGCCPGIIQDKVKVIMGPEDNLELDGEILVTHRTDPGWIPLYPSASGLLVERGGLLSHSAIVAREMGLPTIVSIKGLTKRLKSGMQVEFNGETGLINILDEMSEG